MKVAYETVVRWNGIATIFHSIALATTTFRIVARMYKGQTWWDDYIAFIPLVVDCVYFAVLRESFSLILYPQAQKKGSPTSLRIITGSFFFGVLLQNIIIWTSRMVLVLSIVRLFPNQEIEGQLTLILVDVFILALLGMVVSTNMLCRNPEVPWWINNPPEHQILNAGMAKSWIINTRADLLANISLILTAMLVLYSTDLDRERQQLIWSVIFSSSTGLLSVVAFRIYWVGNLDLKLFYGDMLKTVTVHLLTATSVIICNLPAFLDFYIDYSRKVQF